MQAMKKCGRTRKLDLQRIVVLGVAIVLAAIFSIASKEFRQYTTIVTLFDSMYYYFAFMSIGVTFSPDLRRQRSVRGHGHGVLRDDCGHARQGFTAFRYGAACWSRCCWGCSSAALNGIMVASYEPAGVHCDAVHHAHHAAGSARSPAGGASISWPARSTPEGWFRTIFKYMMPNALGKKTPIPTGLIVVLVLLIIIMSIILNKTRIGRYIIAIGSNKESARLSGVNVVKYQMLAYIISGLFAGIAGIAFASSTFLVHHRRHLGLGSSWTPSAARSSAARP